ncbi:hypothetical protein B0H10DRAFT_2220009 [Mycena sp. CBHHK59/15]|nr:hypothetical protein B0H10DRAFT_2220009 [Mycena sp. CBHHK59/15]
MLAALGAVLATPVAAPQRGGVSPGAAGTQLQTHLGTYPLNATANWHVEQTGSYPPTYIVKEINHNDLAVDVVDGRLTLEAIYYTRQTPTWEINCKQCSSGAASTPVRLDEGLSMNTAFFESMDLT